MSEEVRIRLDLPEELYFKAKAAVQYFRSQKHPSITSLSSLISYVLSKWLDEHVVFQVKENTFEVSETR